MNDRGQSELQERLATILARAPVVPVLTIEEPATAAPLARALAAGGLSIIEVTLRTDAALDAIERIAAELPDVAVGAGTVTSAAQMVAVARRGASFAVSPGATDALVNAALDAGLPFLPGAATASETQRLLEAGIVHQKFFPAEPAGGVTYLRALSAPLPQARFCPTGGIGAANAGAYLACPNVICVGGSWVAPAALVSAQAWPEIEALARAAFGLRGGAAAP